MTVKVKIANIKDKGLLVGDFLRLRTFAIEMPGFKRFVNENVLFELSGKNIGYLSNQPDLEWSLEAKQHLNDYIKDQEYEKRLLVAKDNIDLSQVADYQFKTVPFDHQTKAFLLSRDKKYYGLFMEMGTGKTKVGIDTIAYLYEKGEINCAVILAPNGVHNQWIEEQLPLHLPGRIPHRKAIYAASSKKILQKLDELCDSQVDMLKIVAFNIDALSSRKGTLLIQKFLQKHRAILIIDESTRIKTPGTQRTKAAILLSHSAVYRRIMSGAPITNGYEGLYSQFKFLSPTILGFNSFYTFRNYYCVMGGFEQREIVDYKQKEVKELEDKLAAHTFRITKQECLTLPEKIYIKRYVELTEEQAKIYDALEEDLLTELNGKAISTPITLTKILRMQQVICGHITDEEQNIHNIPNNRINVLMEIVQETLLQENRKIIIWSRFVHDIYHISQILRDGKIGHVTYFGDVNSKDRQQNIAKFKTDPNCNIFLAQPASGGTGLNLAEASTMIYYSNDFNADTRWQSEDRAHRIGQKNNVTYIDLIAKGTVDVQILGALRGKKNLADALLDNPRKFLAE